MIFNATDDYNVSIKLKNEIQVWDPLVRVFHWGLVLAFFISCMTGEDEEAEELCEEVHEVSSSFMLF